MRRLPLTWRLKAKYCQRESICRAMAPSTLSLFLTALMFAGANAADKELGEACASADTCVHPTLELVCDDFTSTCRIKDTKACNGAGHGDLCVTGAECDGSVCGCEGTVYTSVSATGKCVIPAKFWGATCIPAADPATTPAGDCTADSGLACPAGATKCQCEDDKKVDLATGKCTDTIAASKVGKACTDQTACGVVGTTHMTCQSLKCACQDGYSGSTGEDCTAIPASKVGKTCTAGTVATDCGAQATTNLECGTSPAVCKCASNYYGVPVGDCLPAAGKLNGGCSGTGKGTCTESNALCTGTGAKSCKSDLGGACTQLSDCADTTNAVCDAFAKTCLLKTDQTCNSPVTNKDKCVSGASCETTGTTPSNMCKCIATVYNEDTTNKICKAAEGKATGDCKSGDPKCDDANAECVDTKCTCKTGYKLKNADATCEKSGAITGIASALTVMLVAVSGHLITLH